MINTVWQDPLPLKSKYKPTQSREIGEWNAGGACSLRTLCNTIAAKGIQLADFPSRAPSTSSVKRDRRHARLVHTNGR